ncbi:MAG TPA: DNA polymerase III subunit gamma/tau [Candidatus Copromorpha excrementigallinarum]|uniref:DNA-directed DNA polymerase n=1 Tax=Candidatus Allocopromorpha excrementigallinarum TaxID=2840742 RepID=A0A9D1L6W1_9FIRM|nr:DNA polymerase III subunit gamma/tau [Candidatus Copromorpha excrementigallinarum]
MHKALYRTYRPETFEEVLGQEHIVRILKNQINSDTAGHAYLFCGTRGTGKTTMARILAKGLNCLGEGERPCGECSACKSIKEGTYLDVIEIDAASNNGVDNIRELRESVKYPPAAGRKKVYIIDEVHMLSSGAYNALLKTLEEPPEYVVFILATTEPHRLPATILSRCMRLDFKRVPERKLIKGMADICLREGIEAEENALRIIAANADGSVRDGLSILDQCISGAEGKLSPADVLEFLGASGEETFVRLTDSVIKGKTAEAITVLGEALADGKDVRQFMRDWVNHYRNLLMTKFIKDPGDIINLSAENTDRIRKQSDSAGLEDINRGILELSRTLNEARWSTQPRILLEVAIVKLCGASEKKPYESRERLRKNKEEALPVRESPSGENPLKEKKNEALPGDDLRQEKASGGEEYDLNALWRAVFEDGEAAKGSFYIIGSSSRLIGVEEDSFTVETSSEHVRIHAENNRELLEELMEKHTGKRRAMKLAAVKETERDEGAGLERAAAEAEKLLGVRVEIK